MAVREGLLALLERGETHGYQLKADFETATGGIWALNVGQVYATLDRLTRDGLVDSEELDGQRSYRLTEAGGDELGAWWNAGPGDEPPPRDELMMRVLFAISHGRERALDVITQQRNALLVLLQRRQRAARRQSRGVDPLVDELVRDALVVRAESDLRWLDLCEERLNARARSEREASGTGSTARRSRAKRKDGA